MWESMIDQFWKSFKKHHGLQFQHTLGLKYAFQSLLKGDLDCDEETGGCK